MRAIPVLLYHHVNAGGSFINLSLSSFDRQMRFLKDKGYETLHCRDLLHYLNSGAVLARPVVMITFDDGWRDNYLHAYPILKKYGLKAVLFVVTSLVSTQEMRREPPAHMPSHQVCKEMAAQGRHDEVMVSWSELKEMEEAGVMDVQSHTDGHIRCDDPRWSGPHLAGDLAASKRSIEERLDKQCTALCWPWGAYTEEASRTARSCGFELLFTTLKGANTPQSGPFAIKRIAMGEAGPFTLWKKLTIHSHSGLSAAYLNVKNIKGLIGK